MLVGENGVGRRSLARALGFALPRLHRPLAVEYAGPFVFPPPEFLENRRFYRALITTSMECDDLLLLQDAARRTSVFPRFCPHLQPTRLGRRHQDRPAGRGRAPRPTLFAKRWPANLLCREHRY